MDIIGSQWTDKGPCYNTTIYAKLNGQSFEDYLKTGSNDRQELMHAVDAYIKQHASMTDDEISSGGRPIPSTLS